MKERIARALVRAASWPIDRAYYHGQCKGRRFVETGFIRLSHAVTEPLAAAARRVDYEHAVDQMACEGWWG